MNTLIEEIAKVTKKHKKQRFRKEKIKFRKVDDISSLMERATELNLPFKIKSWNSLIFVILILFIFLSFVAKTYKLQIIEGEDNLVLAEGNRIRVINAQAERGLIRDRNGEILVRNLPAFSLEMNTEVCIYKGTCMVELNLLLDRVTLEVDLDRINEELAKAKSNIVIASGITKEEVLDIEAQISDFPNISVSISPVRKYLFDDAFAHLIGYVGFGDTLYPTIEGKAGVEEKYDLAIRGISGGEIIQVNSSGQKVATLSEKVAIPGSDVNLFVDKGLQMKAYELLKEKVDRGEAKAGAVVAQDPKNGGVLALVSYPAFDPNSLSSGLSISEFKKISEDPAFPFFNRAISASYAPASTFKMIMSAAILMEDIVSEHFEIFDGGFIQIGTYIFKNWNTAGHGNVNLRRALQVSNDTYFYTMGGGYGGVGGLGIKKISDWAKKFGFGSTTGIDLSGEVAGFMPDGEHREWYLGDTYITSIGQGDILATPLQVNNVSTYYASNGYLFVPRVAKTVGNQESDTEIINQNIIDEHAQSVILEGLNLAVEPGGTGYPLFDFPNIYNVKLAGKTGTAEFGSPDNEGTHAWFTVFGPLSDSEIALTVFLEEGGSGSSDAAPIARELLNYWFENN